MDEEILKLICPVPFSLMDSKISIEETQCIIRNSLSVLLTQLDSYLPSINLHFSSKFPKRSQIPIQELFKVLDSQDFWSSIRPVTSTQLVNGYNTLTNINLIKSSVFLISTKKSTATLIEKFFLSFQLADPKLKSKLPLSSDFLFKTFSLSNRFLPRRLIQLWINKNSWALASKLEIHPNEFLFLACNTFDRNMLMEKYMPRLDLRSDDKKDGLFRIKDNLMILDPDERLDKMLGSFFVIVKFDFEDPNPVREKDEGSKLGEKKEKRKVDKIIQRTLSKKRVLPNPYRKVLVARPGTVSRAVSSLKLPKARPSSVMKGEKESIDLSKLEMANVSSEVCHVTSFREAIISSFRLPRKLMRTPSYIVKSKIDLSNLNVCQ